MTEIYLGKPPANIEAWISAHVDPQPVGDPYTYFTAFGPPVFKTRISVIENIEDQPNFTPEGKEFEVPKNGIDVLSGGYGCELTSISDGAFANINSDMQIQTLIIPPSAKNIGYQAFSMCNTLRNLNLGNVEEIGVQAFNQCGILSVLIPDSVTVFGSDAFQGCEDLKTVELRCQTVGNAAFQGCSSLSSVTLGPNVVTIGDNAFEGCYGLKTIAIPNTVKTIGQDAFTNTGFTTLSVNSQTIKIYAFSYCSDLSAVVLGDAISAIGNGAFEGCADDLVITVPNQAIKTLVENSGFTGEINIAS